MVEYLYVLSGEATNRRKEKEKAVHDLFFFFRLVFQFPDIWKSRVVRLVSE